MRVHKIIETLRSRAYKLALSRGSRARGVNAESYFEYDGFPQIRRDWQGAIGELIMVREYPWLTPETDEANFVGSIDFSVNGLKIDLKTQYFPVLYPRYLFNVSQVRKREGVEILIATGIDDDPSIASKFYEFGYISRDTLTSYPVVEESPSGKSLDPAYDVPLDAFKPISKIREESPC